MAFLFISTTSVPNIISTFLPHCEQWPWLAHWEYDGGVSPNQLEFQLFQRLKIFLQLRCSNDAIFYQRLINDWTFLHWAGALFAPALSKLINSGWSMERAVAWPKSNSFFVIIRRDFQELQCDFKRLYCTCIEGKCSALQSKALQLVSLMFHIFKREQCV